MEEIFKYAKRQNLYQFLIDDYGFKVEEEKDYKEMGYYVVLASNLFLLKYYYDQLFLSVDIYSVDDKKNLYDLSFVKDLIYNSDSINVNADETIQDNATRIKELNDFLRKDFKKVCELFSKTNYPDTRKRLDEALRKQFLLKNPPGCA